MHFYMIKYVVDKPLMIFFSVYLCTHEYYQSTCLSLYICLGWVRDKYLQTKYVVHIDLNNDLYSIHLKINLLARITKLCRPRFSKA